MTFNSYLAIALKVVATVALFFGWIGLTFGSFFLTIYATDPWQDQLAWLVSVVVLVVVGVLSAYPIVKLFQRLWD